MNVNGEALSYAEIAAALGVHRTTIAKRIARGQDVLAVGDQRRGQQSTPEQRRDAKNARNRAWRKRK